MGYDFEKDVPTASANPGSSPADSAKSEIETLGTTPSKTATDIVCPICFRQLTEPTIMGQGHDEYKRELRTYFGYCHHCKGGCVVVQFAREGRWVIHKYRPAVVIGMAGILNISDNWQVMSELPPVDFNQNQDAGAANAGLIGALAEIHKAMMNCCSTIELLIRSLAEKRGQSIDG